MTRSSAGAAVLVDVAVEHGMTVAQCLAGSGITPAMLDNPASEIRASQELTVVCNIVDAIGDVPALGIEAGGRYRLTFDGIWAFAVVTSPTVRHGFRTGTDYMGLGSSFATWRFSENDTAATATLDYSGVPARVRTFLMERDVATLATIDREIFGTLMKPDSVELACPEPVYADRFPELIGVMPIFGAPRTRILLSNQVLDIPMPQSSPQLAELARIQAAQLLQQRLQRQGIAERVRQILLARGTNTDQNEVAAALAISIRTLRRRLEDDGTSYRELVGETRRLLAEELLGIGATVEDVAHRLGYADAAAFSHAFTRWTGTTPGRYARAHR